MAVETLVNITQDEIEYARMTTLLKSELDYQSGMAEAEEKGRAEGLAEGRAEGLAEGRAEGLLEVARKMKNAGDSIKKIHIITGLPTETIKQL